MALGRPVLARPRHVEIWAVGPALVILGFAAITRGRRLALPLAGGLAAGLAVMVGPFVASDPAAAWHQTILAQAGRARTNTSLARTWGLLAPDGALKPLAFALAAIGIAVAVAGLAFAIKRGGQRFWRQAPWPWCWLAVGLTCVAELLVGPSFFQHYWAFAAPWIALGAAFAFFAAIHLGKRLRAPVPARWIAAAAACAAGLLLTFNAFTTPTIWTAPVNSRQWHAWASAPGCPWALLSGDLIASGVLSSAIARGCPFPVDWSGQIIMTAAHLPYPENGGNPITPDELYGRFKVQSEAAGVVIARPQWTRQLGLDSDRPAESEQATGRVFEGASHGLEFWRVRQASTAPSPGQGAR